MKKNIISLSLTVLLFTFSIPRTTFANVDTRTNRTYSVSDEKQKESEETKEIITESIEKTEPKAVEVNPAGIKRAVLSSQKIFLNGDKIDIQAYNIDGYNYFKLRTLAAFLSGTGSSFDISYDKSANTVKLFTGKDYKILDTDLKVPDDGIKTAFPSKQNVLINEADRVFKAYNIEGSNYFKLQDLKLFLDFGLEYKKDSNSVIIKTAFHEKKPELRDMNFIIDPFIVHGNSKSQIPNLSQLISDLKIKDSFHNEEYSLSYKDNHIVAYLPGKINGLDFGELTALISAQGGKSTMPIPEAMEYIKKSRDKNSGFYIQFQTVVENRIYVFGKWIFEG